MKTKKKTLKNRNWMYGLLLVWVVAALILLAGQPTPAVAQAARKQVLYINSYHPGYKFSDDITRALFETFNQQGNIDLRVEYLDSKRVDSPEYQEQVSQLYQEKYKNTRLDLIISSDDAALNFLFKYADRLFPDVPVVFVGANFFDVARLDGYSRFTGISEEADISGTLDVALRLNPDTRKVVIVNDTTVTGQIVHQLIEQVIPEYPQIKFEFLEQIAMPDLQRRLGSLTPDTIVLLTIFSRDGAGSFFEYDQYTSLIAQSSAVPVYGTWDFSLGYGIVGGKLTSGYTEGTRTAQLALRILGGENPASIPVQKTTQAQYMFDYKVLQKWGIPLSRLPEGSFVLDRPISFYEQNPTLVWVLAIGFLVLVGMIIFLVINNNQQRRSRQELARSNQELQSLQATLENRVEERTRDLSTVAEIGTAASTILDINRLLQRTVDLAKERFGLYHAHIYLLDEAGENLVLASGAGDVGREMVAAGHFIPINLERSLVARAARERKGVIVNDVTLEPDFLPNPLLPDTRAEMAVPMVIGEKVVGVFDVQSAMAGRFTEADISVKTALASQIASAVQNARSFTQVQRSQELLTEALRIAQIGNWEYDVETDTFTFNDQFYEIFGVSAAEVGGYKLSSSEYAQRFVHPEDAPLVGREIERALASKERYFRATVEHRAILGNGEIGYFTVNITLERDENGKVLRWYGANQNVTERRRIEELNRQRAERQEIVNTISQKIQETTSIEDALKIAARELGHALGKKPTLVALESSAFSGESQGN